jgi:hypothetical protein
MSTLTSFLEERLRQLNDRKFMIPRYVKQPGAFAGKKDFSLKDLPKIQEEIEETKAALAGIQKWKSAQKQTEKKNVRVQG